MNKSNVLHVTFYHVDVKKMPLGKLSKAQIAKGFEALEEIEQAVRALEHWSTLEDLSSQFYTIIPHSFGRRLPPVIDDEEKLQAKKNMLLVSNLFHRSLEKRSMMC